MTDLALEKLLVTVNLSLRQEKWDEASSHSKRRCNDRYTTDHSPDPTFIDSRWKSYNITSSSCVMNTDSPFLIKKKQGKR